MIRYVEEVPCRCGDLGVLVAHDVVGGTADDGRRLGAETRRIGPTPTSAVVRPGTRPEPDTLITVPSAAEVPIVIAAGSASSAIFEKLSVPLALSPTLTANPSLDEPVEEA